MSTQGTRQCHWRICSSSLLHHILYPPSNLISGGCDSVLWHPWVIGLKHTQHQWKVNRKQAWKAYLEQRNGILIWLFTRCLISVSLCELFFLYKDKTVQIQTILHWYTITVNLPSYHCKKISSFEIRGANKAEMGQNYCFASHKSQVFALMSRVKSKVLNYEFRVLNKSLALFTKWNAILTTE